MVDSSDDLICHAWDDKVEHNMIIYRQNNAKM